MGTFTRPMPMTGMDSGRSVDGRQGAAEGRCAGGVELVAGTIRDD